MKKKVQSWLGVFKQETDYKEVTEYSDLLEHLEQGYKPSGSFHSYNRQALHEKTIVLKGRFDKLKYNPICETIQVGAGVSIREVMEELLKHDRKLLNSGNYFEQTFVGAAIGGTHGYGLHSALADSVLQFEGVFDIAGELFIMIANHPNDLRNPYLKAVTWAVVATEPTKSYKVTNCVCNLSDIGPNVDGIAQAYAVLPYSDPQNPVCMIAQYETNTEVKVGDIAPKKRTRPWHWWRVKLWWKIDQFLPTSRKIIQRVLNFIKLKPFVIYTHPNDYDALYDPDPGLTGTTGSVSFTRWAYRPTHTCYNISVFARPEDTADIILFATSEAEKLKSTLLRCFIAVRCLQGQSHVDFVGNSDGDRDAIDLYCSPKHAKYLIELQTRIQNKFDVRPHYGKTVLRRR
jgi:hypothetical protein